ncbi:MAG: helix-turn-helix domain-containing protein, partial [Longicatena sp.]
MARNKYPKKTIAKILDVSLHLFSEKGYEKTTIQDIVNALG